MNAPSPHHSAAPLSRRAALQAAGVVGGGILAGSRAAHAQSPSSDVIRVGLIGAGGRGTGALQQTLSVPGSNVKLTAVADAFEDRIEAALKAVESMKDKIDCPEDRRFKGLDGYQKVIENCDLVILATPPGFRPFHFDAAIKAGRHVFMEKPICIDSFGARLCLEAAKMADEKRLKVVVGLQRHYDDRYRQTVARVREGLAGDIIAGQIFWNGDRPWYKNRKPGMSELEYQVYNWGHFNWLCGDHIVEQHVHNIDVVNWATKGHPLRARGMGGRQVRTDAKWGNIFDHHAVQFEYADGFMCFSECRQIDGCANDVSEHVYGTDGSCHMDGGNWRIVGKNAWKHDGANNDPYQTEHDDLFASIRSGNLLNEGQMVAESTMSAILGRMATYTGKVVTWDEALASNDVWGPEKLEFGPLAVDAVPVPGKSKKG
jgi:predicted dehydrogenase